MATRFVCFVLVVGAHFILLLNVEGAANIYNKQSRTADKGWSSGLGVGRVILTLKKITVTKCYAGPRNWWALVNAVMKLRVL
jgi:hypothetical protein